MFLLFHEEDCSTKNSGFATEVGTYVDLEQKVVYMESAIKDKDIDAALLVRNELLYL